jgi:3-hydroxyanthranilate 3,4-dioxygenase
MANSLVPFNLQGWIDDHRDLLRPPVGNQLIWQDSQFIVMIVGGPNSRRDFHIDPGDEFFYQLEGDMVLEFMDAEGKRQRAPICQGEVLLCPANTPHSPQRPQNTVGLVVERVRGVEESEGFAWYCERCDAKLHEIFCPVGDIVLDLPKVLGEFNADESLRTCSKCGYVQPVPAGPRA